MVACAGIRWRMYPLSPPLIDWRELRKRGSRMRIDSTTDHGARTLKRLENDRIVWLTTVDSKATPQPNPVWFHWDGEALVIYSRPDTPKVRNISRNPRVSLSFNTNEHGGDVMVLTGEAAIDESIPSAAEHPAYLEKYRDGIQSIGMTNESFSSTYSVPIRVRPEKLRGF
jgi:PPOX class probable F420-dependent enzyme